MVMGWEGIRESGIGKVCAIMEVARDFACKGGVGVDYGEAKGREGILS